MNKFLCALCCALSFSLQAQSIFPVCAVEKPDTLMEEQPYDQFMADLLERRYFIQLMRADDQAAAEPVKKGKKKNRQPEAVPERPVLEARGPVPADGVVNTYGNNAFVMAAAFAYAEHRPLTISPDMIWLLVCQGFGQHVDLNAEALRHKFVAHSGKKTLCIRRDDYVRGDATFPWPETFDDFNEQIAAHTDSALVACITGDFSTSTPITRAALQVSMMDAMSSYFTYAMDVLCGIPEIHLEGKPEDWETLERRCAELGQYDLEWWTGELQPVLREFTLASKGNANPAFWEDMYRETVVAAGCTEDVYINGWILKFFPYINKERNNWVSLPDSVRQYREALQNAVSADGVRNYVSAKKFGLQTVELGDLPDGLSSADLLLNYHGTLLKYSLNAGFVGITQDRQTLALCPQINWFIIDTKQAPDAVDLESYTHFKNRTLAAEERK